MLDSLINLVVVLFPTAISLISVLIGRKLAQNAQDRSHYLWWCIAIVLGSIGSLAMFWQIERSQNAHAQEIKEQKADNARLQSSVDNLSGQMTAFGVVLSNPNRNGSLDIKAISDEMKRIGQSSQAQSLKSEKAKLSIRDKLAHLLEGYHMVADFACKPDNIGPRYSGAGQTKESCDLKYAEWSQETFTYICKSGELEAADCIEYRWANSWSEKQDVVKKLIERYRKTTQF